MLLDAQSGKFDQPMPKSVMALCRRIYNYRVTGYANGQIEDELTSEDKLGNTGFLGATRMYDLYTRNKSIA